MDIALHIVILLFTFYVLAVICDYFFVPSLEELAAKRKMSSEFAWATLMAVGSSAPELFTSLFAVLNPAVAPSLGAWTIVGSAIFNILVIIGAAAMVRNAVITWQPVVRDLIFYSIAIVLLLFVFWDGQIVLWEMIVFLAVYILYVYCAKNWRLWLGYDEPEWEDDLEEETNPGFLTRCLCRFFSLFIPDPEGKYFGMTFFLSIVVIGVATHFMVDSGVHVAQGFGIHPSIIGLTILAMGTSVPDLLSSLVVAKKGKGDMAVTNAVWSNIFDILFGLSVPYLIYFAIHGTEQWLAVDNTSLTASIVLLLASVLAVTFLLLAKQRKINRISGIFLISLYVLYVVYMVIQVVG